MQRGILLTQVQAVGQRTDKSKRYKEAEHGIKARKHKITAKVTHREIQERLQKAKVQVNENASQQESPSTDPTDESESVEAGKSAMIKKRLLRVKSIWFRHHVKTAFHQWLAYTSYYEGIDPGDPFGSLKADAYNIFSHFRGEEKRPLDSECLNLLIKWGYEVQGQTFKSCPLNKVEDIMQNLQYVEYQNGECLFVQGDSGVYYYILIEGAVALYVGAPAESMQKIAENRVHALANNDLLGGFLGFQVFTVVKGNGFGEIALYSDDNIPRTASAVAVGKSKMLLIPKVVYKRSLQEQHQAVFIRTQKMTHLSKLKLFAGWTKASLITLAEKLDQKMLPYGTQLMTHGVVCDTLYFIVSGSVKITREEHVTASPKHRRHQLYEKLPNHQVRTKKVNVEIAILSAGDLVGAEMILYPNSILDYDVIVSSTELEVYCLRKQDARHFLDHSRVGFMEAQLKVIHEAQSSHRKERYGSVQHVVKGSTQPYREAPMLAFQDQTATQLEQGAPSTENPKHVHAARSVEVGQWTKFLSEHAKNTAFHAFVKPQTIQIEGSLSPRKSWPHAASFTEVPYKPSLGHNIQPSSRGDLDRKFIEAWKKDSMTCAGIESSSQRAPKSPDRRPATSFSAASSPRQQRSADVSFSKPHSTSSSTTDQNTVLEKTQDDDAFTKLDEDIQQVISHHRANAQATKDGHSGGGYPAIITRRQHVDRGHEISLTRPLF